MGKQSALPYGGNTRLQEPAVSLDSLKDKKVGVVLSSGFFGFFAHAGCLQALEDRGISVSGYAGSSAGAIVAAFAASGMTAGDIKTVITGLTKEAFWDPEHPLLTIMAVLRLFRGWHGRLRGDKFRRLLECILPVTTFEELTIPCVIAGTNLTRKKKQIFTAGSLADAVQASCTVPWLFKFKRLDEALFIDGGLVDKAPVEAMAHAVRPDVIIVHYLFSRNLTDSDDAFLTQKFSPHKAFTLSVDIARHEHYRAQKRLVRQQGIEVIELSVPDLPRVAPDSLEKGEDAFARAYSYAHDYFSS